MSIIRKRYTKLEKLEIVTESLEDHIEIAELANRYSLHANTIRRWRQELATYREAAFPGNGNAILSEEQKEIERLRRQLKESELANEILKKALGIISSPNRKNLLS
jgi:transposase